MQGLNNLRYYDCINYVTYIGNLVLLECLCHSGYDGMCIWP
jgi:hypothetical protein